MKNTARIRALTREEILFICENKDVLLKDRAEADINKEIESYDTSMYSIPQIVKAFKKYDRSNLGCVKLIFSLMNDGLHNAVLVADSLRTKEEERLRTENWINNN